MRRARWPERRRSSASLAAVVVLPEPCRPTSITTDGGVAAAVRRPSPAPSRFSSSSWTILMTCCPGVRLSRTSLPTARSRTAATKSRATRRFTSASRRTMRTWRSASSTSRSVRRPRPVIFWKTPFSFSVSDSNIPSQYSRKGTHAAPVGGVPCYNNPMLKKLRLTNFKAFGDPGLEIEPGLITVLIGPNGTGKSSVLQALLLLKQQGFGDDLLVTNDRLVDFGTYLDLVHNHRNQLSVDLEILVDEPDHNVAYWGMNASERTKVVHRLAEHPRDQIEGDRWRNKRDLTGDSSNRVSMQVQRFLADFVFVPTMRGFSRRRYEPGGEIPTDITSLNDPEQCAHTTP